MSLTARVLPPRSGKSRWGTWAGIIPLGGDGLPDPHAPLDGGDFTRLLVQLVPIEPLAQDAWENLKAYCFIGKVSVDYNWVTREYRIHKNTFTLRGLPLRPQPTQYATIGMLLGHAQRTVDEYDKAMDRLRAGAAESLLSRFRCR